MRLYKYLILLLTLVAVNSLCSFAFSYQLEEHSAFRGEFSPDNIDISQVLYKGKEPFNVVSMGWIIQFERCDIYKITPALSNKYSFYVLSDVEGVSFSLVDKRTKDILGISKQEGKRKARRSLNHFLQKGEEYFLIVGGSSEKKEIPYHLISYSGLNPEHDTLKLNIQREVEREYHKISLSEDGEKFEGKRAIYFNIEKYLSKYNYLEVEVTSENFDPVLYSLDRYNRVLDMHDDVSRINKNSKLVIKSNKDTYAIVIAAYSSSKSSSEIVFDLNCKGYNYDPSGGVLSFAKYYSGGPVGTFILGALASFFVGLFFYRRSSSMKIIRYQELLDHTMFAENDKSSPLSIHINNEEVKCASLYKFRLSNAGPSKITSDLVREPLYLQLENIEKILDIDFQNKGNGWHVPDIVDDTKVKIEFDYIDSEDSLELLLICKHKADAENFDIGFEVIGNISETKILSINENPPIILFTIESIINMIFLILAPFLLLDVWFDVMPEWFGYYLGMSFQYVFPFLIIYYFLTKTGRIRVSNTFRTIFHSIKWLFKRKSSNKAFHRTR